MCDRCADLEYELARLKATLAPEAQVPKHWRLSARERRLYGALMRGGVVPYERLAILMGHSGRDVTKNALTVYIARIRQRVRRQGLDIRADRNVGYELVRVQ